LIFILKYPEVQILKKCIECGLETHNPKFCCNSCSARFNNRNRKDKCPGKSDTKTSHCIDCGVSVIINLRASHKNTKCDICSGKCKYCKSQAKYRLKNGALCCEDSWNRCPEVRRKNADGVRKAHIEGKIPGWNDLRTQGIDTAWSRGLTGYEDSRIKCSYDSSTLFTNGSIISGPRKEILIKERGYKCERCSISEWMGNPIILELDHIDGNNVNNLKENLRLLCPNCHSQTPTWRGRNVNTGRRKVPEDTIIEIFKRTKSISKTLIECNMAPKGANYKTMYKLIEKYNLCDLI